MHFFPVPHTLLPLKFQGHGGAPAPLTRPCRPAPSGRSSALRAKYLSQVAAKTPSLLKVPPAGWVAAPPWGRGRGHLPGGSLHLVLSGRPRKGGQAPETPGPSNGVDSDLFRDRGPRQPTSKIPRVCAGERGGGAPSKSRSISSPTGTEHTAGGQWQVTRGRHPYWPSHDWTATHSPIAATAMTPQGYQ